jgi:hypothetical protein
MPAPDQRPDRRRRPQRPANPVDVNQRYSIPETCGYLDISHMTLHAKVKAGQIAVIRENSRVLIPGSEIARLSQPPAQSAA